MGLTSSDIANATANQAARKLEDQAAIIDWLLLRVLACEEALAIIHPDCPELPSVRSQRLSREYMEQCRNEWANGNTTFGAIGLGGGLLR